MVLQHIYGRDPVIGYCDKKYSKALETDEILTSRSMCLNKNIINPKVNYVLPQYLYGGLPNCYYLIQKAGCAVFGKSSYVEAGRSEYINHNYIFTDVGSALDIFSGKSIFDINIFLSRVEHADGYDIENAVFAKNDFDIGVVNDVLKKLCIDRNLFEKIIFAVIESVYLGTRVYIVPKNMNKTFTDEILELIKGIFYALPKKILEKIGFITYFATFPSLSNNVDGSIRIACIERTYDNLSMIEHVVADGNFVFQFGDTGYDVIFPKGIDTSGMAVMQLFSGAIFDNTGVGYNYIFESPDVFPSNSYLLNIIYIWSKYKDSPDEAIDDITYLLRMSVGFDDLFKKFENIAKYFEPCVFLEALYSCAFRLLEKSHYSNLMDFANKVFYIIDNYDNIELTEKLDKIVHFFVDRYMGSIQNIIDMDDVAAEQILLWSDRLFLYVGKENHSKLYNINMYKRLKAAMQNLSPDCVNIYLIADTGVKKKLAYDIGHLASLYLKNTDYVKDKVFYYMLPILLESYLGAFKLAWTKGGLGELVCFVTKAEHNSLLHDMDSGLLSQREIARSLRMLFKTPGYLNVLEKAAKSDSKIKVFAKKYKLL